MKHHRIPRGGMLAALAAAAIAAASCDLVDTETAGAGPAGTAMDLVAGPSDGARGAQGAFFPLAIGNRWAYEGEFSIRMEGGAPQTERTYETRTLTGHETLFGREYVIENRMIIYNAMPPCVEQWVRYRQDKAGLYEADVSINDPPGDGASPAGGLVTTGTVSPWPRLLAALAAEAPVEDLSAFEAARETMRRKLALAEYLFGGSGRALLGGGPPGGVLPDEITRLRYPLHAGQEWIVRDSPPFTSAVEGRELLDVPAGRFAGWRIRVDCGMFGPNDRVLLWYGRDGMLARYARFEVELTGPSGESRGTMISEERLVLAEIEID